MVIPMTDCTLPDPDAVEVTIGCKQDTEAELSDCHHYEGIRCIFTAECSYEAKRDPCPFDDAEARVCPTCGGNGYVQMGGNDWRKTCPDCHGTGERS